MLCLVCYSRYVYFAEELHYILFVGFLWLQREFLENCVDIREGDFSNPAYCDLLRSATVIYCNNYNGIFGARTQTVSGYPLGKKSFFHTNQTDVIHF